MTNRCFDIIRFLSEVAITAAGVFFKAIAEIWGLPYGDAVLATCAAVSTFLGIFTEWQRFKHNKQEEKDEEDISESK